jgi:V8-like Glu-specific endopeptidase
MKQLFPAALWFIVIGRLFAQSADHAAVARVIETLDGKTIQRPVIQTSEKAFVTVQGKGKEKAIEIEDKQNLLNSRPEVPLKFAAESTVAGKKAEITDVKLAAVQQVQTDLDRRIDPEKKPFVSNTTKAIAELDQVSKEALRTGDEGKAKETLVKIDATKEGILKDYAAAPKSEHTVRDTLGLAYLKQRSVRKAWYGRDDNYRPEVYEMIYKQSRSCVGITPHNKTKLRGSGVLIGPNTVLTAGHVVEDAVNPNEFDVLFDYEQTFDPENKQLNEKSVIRRRVTSAYFLGKAPDPDSSPLDYVLLEIESAKKGQDRPPIPISIDRVTLETPIFLVGHPRGAERLIHDNSWVKFPYQVSQAEFTDLLALVNGELKAAGAEDAAQEADNFIQFYKQQIDHKSYFYVDRRDGKAEHSMGAECDTFRGDSGAPAMLRETGEVVGILVAGEADQEMRPNEGRVKSNAYTASWIHHETLLPIVKVVEQLDKEKSGWRNECGVEIKD